MKNTLIAAALLCLSLATPLLAQDTDETDIRTLLTRRVEIFNAQEYDRLVPLFATARQAERTAIIAAQKDAWKAKKLTITGQQAKNVTINGDKAEAEFEFELNGKHKSEHLSLVREADGWRIDTVR